MKKEEKTKLKKFYIIIGIIVISIILIDQISKALIIYNGEITLIPNVLTLKFHEMHNETSEDTYEDTSRAVNILTNLVIIGIVLGIIKSNNQFIKKKTKILLSLALAGGISNIVDRICRGGIVEFINLSNLPAFNIADVCIIIGWISFVAIFASFSAKELSDKKQAKKKNLENEDKTL